MKKNLLIIFLSIFSTLSYGQKISQKDIFGFWRSTDTSVEAATIMFQFGFDEREFIQSYEKDNVNTRDTLQYTLDNTSKPTILHIYGKSSEGKKINKYFFIKIKNKYTLKLQGKTDGSKLLKWNNNETDANTKVMNKIIRFTPPKIVKDEN